MYLRALTVENYRGIRLAQITFERSSTVIIAENDAGRSSLLEALARVLGNGTSAPPPLAPHHFHSRQGRPSGPIAISVTLEENSPGDWTPPDPLARAWPRRTAELKSLTLRFEARQSPSNGIETTWLIRPGPRARALPATPDLIAWVRTISPLGLLRDGLQVPPEDLMPSGWREHFDPERIALIELLNHHYAAIFSGSTPDLPDSLEQGAQAALALLNRSPESISAISGVLGPAVNEIMGRSEEPRGLTVATASPAQKFGLLLLISSLLHASGRPLSPESRPVLAIEEPETRLHPMTLAAVWRLLESLPWQLVLSTNSDELLARIPMRSLRRITRSGGELRQYRIPEHSLSSDDLRRLTYHVRFRRGAAMFARCWLLVEGETEFWLLPELARILGADFAAEGVACVEFAQCGAPPLVRVASSLGIEWHLLADGDDAGRRYALSVAPFIYRPERLHLNLLEATDLETCFAVHGFEDVFRDLARIQPKSHLPLHAIVAKALERHAKPTVALRLLEAAARRGPQSIPPPLINTIESSLALARLSR